MARRLAKTGSPERKASPKLSHGRGSGRSAGNEHTGTRASAGHSQEAWPAGRRPRCEQMGTRRLWRAEPCLGNGVPCGAGHAGGQGRRAGRIPTAGQKEPARSRPPFLPPGARCGGSDHCLFITSARSAAFSGGGQQPPAGNPAPRPRTGSTFPPVIFGNRRHSTVCCLSACFLLFVVHGNVGISRACRPVTGSCRCFKQCRNNKTDRAHAREVTL